MATATKATKITPTTKAAAAEAEAKRYYQAAALMKQTGDATRLRVLMLLMDGEQNVTAISTRCNQSQPCVSHHLAMMRHGGLITPRRDGKNNMYSLTEKGRALTVGVKAIID